MIKVKDNKNFHKSPGNKPTYIPKHNVASIEVYTDGGCLIDTKEKVGAWAFVIIFRHSLENNDNNEEIYHISSGFKDATTNNEMELTACKNALEYLENKKDELPYKDINVYTDSMYLQKGCNMWIFKWKANDWKNYMGENVKHKELWEAIDNHRTSFNLNFIWVKGHSDNEFNEKCDSIVKEEMTKRMKNLTK
jgi:ribonuclease HI